MYIWIYKCKLAGHALHTDRWHIQEPNTAAHGQNQTIKLDWFSNNPDIQSTPLLTVRCHVPTIGVCDVCASGFKEPTARSHTCQMFAWGAMGKAGNARTLNLRKGGSGFGILSDSGFWGLGFGFAVFRSVCMPKFQRD